MVSWNPHPSACYQDRHRPFSRERERQRAREGTDTGKPQGEEEVGRAFAFLPDPTFAGWSSLPLTGLWEGPGAGEPEDGDGAATHQASLLG